MIYQNLHIEVKEGIAYVTINREKALNALNKQTLTELSHFFGKDFAGRKDIKGVILVGAGEKAFVAGADIKEFLHLTTEGSGGELAKRGQDAFFLIENFHRPVVAIVHGYALGGGCELAMACHMRIATTSAKFGQPEVNLGIIPGYGGTQRLVQLIGKTKAIELTLTADMIGAEEAHRLGLLNYVEEDKAAAIRKAEELLTKIGKKGPVAIQAAIQAINAYFAHDTNGFAEEVAAFDQTTTTKDFQEGVTAFIEKRKADFKGE